MGIFGLPFTPETGGAGASTLAYIVAFAAALMVNGCRGVAADDPAGSTISQNDLDLLQRTMKEVQKSYVEPVKPGDLTTGALIEAGLAVVAFAMVRSARFEHRSHRER